jgi:pimeloyl-ACP methyl ester carboxylesterase
VPVASRWFDEQFARRERFPTLGGYISVVDVTPPDFLADSDGTPVVFVPGFLANVEGFRLTMEAFAATGKRVIGLTNSYQKSPRFNVGRYHDTIVQKCDDLLTLVAEKSLHGCDVIAHSEGFTVSVLASKIYAGEHDGTQPFRIIEGVAPHGLRRLDVQDAIRGPMMIVEGARQMTRHPNVGAIFRGTLHYCRNNARQMSREAIALLGTDVAGIVNEVAAGTDVGVLLLRADEVISARKHYRLFESGQLRVSAVSTVVNRNARHAALLLDPTTIGAAVAMLDSMRGSQASKQRRAA